MRPARVQTMREPREKPVWRRGDGASRVRQRTV